MPAITAGGSPGFWGSFLSVFKNVAIPLALDTAALLMGGGSKSNPDSLKDKSFRSDAYGTNWMRCRGVVRCQGKDLWGTRIQTSFWKTVSGGLFGIGSTSVVYPKYSASRFIGFGKHLNGGAAVSFLRLWADGKLLYNKLASTGNITGAATVTPGQSQFSQFLSIDLASGASVTINPGDLLIIPSDPDPYSAQVSITASGPTTIQVQIWPPLRHDLVSGGGQVVMPTVSGSPYDLSSFDPNPHDGSHPDGGYEAPPGGIRFYLGADDQAQDPLMVKKFGAANVPGYRGLVCCMIHDLQLANYGDHFPQITAEIAYDVASPIYPQLGPVDSTPLIFSSLTPEFFALPFSGNAIVNYVNPLNALTDLWIFSQVGQDATNDGTIYRVNTQTNQLEASKLIERQGTFRLCSAGMIADADGFLYFVQNNSILSKVDGFSLATVGTWAGFPANVLSMYAWDTVQSLFGNPILIKLLAAANVIVDPQTIRIFDRTVLLPLGVAAGGGQPVVVAYDQKGNPIVSTGNPITISDAQGAGGSKSYTDDKDGNLFHTGGDDLYKIDCQFISTITLDENDIPHPILGLPTFAETTCDISTLRGGSFTSAQYYPGDNSIVIFGANIMGKVDIDTMSIIQTETSTGTGSTKEGQADVMGTIVVSSTNALGGTHWERVDLSSLQVINSYFAPNWFPPGTGFPHDGYAVFDPATDSMWADAQNNGSDGGLNRMFLDRGNGDGIDLGDIVSSLMLEAGYSAGQFDVTQLTSAGLTCFGVEFERETFLESLQKLMRHYLFDAAEIDGKIVFVPRGQSSVLTIPEDDLGALAEPDSYEPRVAEILTDERDVPAKVTIKYYDPLKDSQQATQEFKRTLQPYPSDLSTAKEDTTSKQEVDIVSPITEHALAIKQQAYRILWDAVAGRFTYKFKLPPKYVRLDPTDVITLTYKGYTLLMRITEADFGASFAREITAVSQDNSAYDASSVTGSSPGVGSGDGSGSTPSPTPSPATLSYTIDPAIALSEASPTEVDMVDVTATWSDGRVTKYAARGGGSPPTGFMVADPGAGNSQIYFVTIYDPNRTGESGSPALTDFCETTPNAAHLGETGYVFIGTITITHDGIGVVVTSGGSQNITQAEGFYVNGSGGSPQQSQIDLLNYVLMDATRRASFHLEGTAANSQMSKNYTYIDTATHSVAQIKATAGWAADILLYYSDYIKQFITELDDPGHRDWSVNTSYKKLDPPLAVMPRYFTPGGGKVTITHASPNNYDRLVSCSVIDTLDKGDFTAITYGPITMNFDKEGDGAGNLGDIQVMVNERYSGAKARERFYWGKDATGGLGFVKWDSATLVSGEKITGIYKITNWSVHNKLVAGGGVVPSFGCGYGIGWP